MRVESATLLRGRERQIEKGLVSREARAKSGQAGREPPQQGDSQQRRRRPTRAEALGPGDAREQQWLGRDAGAHALARRPLGE